MEKGIEGKPLSNSDKARILNQMLEKSEDNNPVWIHLFKPENLPWGGMKGQLVPSKGTLIKVLREKGFKGQFSTPNAIVVDLTRMRPMPELPYTKLPLRAVVINEQNEVWVDCRIAVEAGIGLGLYNFEVRSDN